MIDLIVEVRGGVVQEVYCDDSSIRVVLIDWDELESSAPPGGVWPPCHPLNLLPDDTLAEYEQAILESQSDSPGIINT